jgi:sulfate permease, SulP family
MLAAATFGILVAGPAIIGYIPVLIVGTLIFMLGIELVKEALWDTFGRVHRLEYLTVNNDTITFLKPLLTYLNRSW